MNYLHIKSSHSQSICYIHLLSLYLNAQPHIPISHIIYSFTSHPFVHLLSHTSFRFPLLRFTASSSHIYTSSSSTSLPLSLLPFLYCSKFRYFGFINCSICSVPYRNNLDIISKIHSILINSNDLFINSSIVLKENRTT